MTTVPPDLPGKPRQYTRAALDEAAVAGGWLALFQQWYSEAQSQPEITEPNAMQLATVDAEGTPSVRTVLAKQVDERGVTFFTGYDSAKGHDLAVRPVAAVVFAWLPLERQVRFTGPTTRVSAEETEAYFRSRPRGAQIGAWASHQSAVLQDRAELEESVATTERRFAGRDVPVPPDWGGFRIDPAVIEFWTGRENRLHDRLLGRRVDDRWSWQRLSP